MGGATFEVLLDRDDNRHRLRLREALHIMLLKPTLSITRDIHSPKKNVRRNQLPPNNDGIAAEGTAV